MTGDTSGPAAYPDGRGFGRRQFLKTTAAGLGAVLAWQVVDAAPALAGTPVSGPAAVPIPFDMNWLFGPSVSGGTAPGFDDSSMVTVTLPHTVTPLSWQQWDPASWERVWLYRKHFGAPAGSGGMRVFADFAAAMTASSLTLNGHDLPGRTGGYLPFTAELTGALHPTGNVLAFTLDSRYNPEVPPGRSKPLPAVSSDVDYWQPGGIYRGVQLRVVPKVFLADVFAKPVNVLDATQRRVEVECTIDAATVPQGGIAVTVDLRDGARKVASTTVPVNLTRTGQATVTATLSGLGNITLWDFGDPHLYDVVVTLSISGTAVHDYRVRTGFREARFALDGFFLNGRRVKLFGLTRHQNYPFAGDAMPGRVQAKDAEILRNDLNCNMVRCSHYPQSEAFLDACDELGLLVWEEAPGGGGQVGDSTWQAFVVRDVGDMVRRDRNHPSVIIWGARLNESTDDATLWTTTNNVAHSLDDSRPTAGAMHPARYGDTDYQQDVWGQNDYSRTTGPDGLTQPELFPPLPGRPYLVTEAVGAISGPFPYYRRTDAQVVQQGQAAAHARVHDLAASDDRYCGLLAWSGYDYESGNGRMYQGVKYTGVVDLFRVLKPGAAIYQAQVDPKTRPVIAPAFYWDFGPTSPVSELGPAMICSNLDRLEVYVAGSHFATVTPDATNYGHLPYPPSFADFSSVDGSGHPELRIDGYLGATKVLSRSFASDPAGDRLALAIDDTRLTGDGSDATRVAFRAVDRYGHPRPYVEGDVTLSVDGPAALVGGNPFPFAATGGAGAVWLRTIRDTPGTVTLTARHPALGSASVTAQITLPAPGGSPAPYGTLQASASSALAVPGTPSMITAAFTNNGLPGLQTLTLSPRLPQGWSAQAATETTFSGVKSGQQVSVSWHVTAPAGAAPGSYETTIVATYTAHGERGVSATTLTFLTPSPSLAAAFDNAGISDDSDVGSASFDGVGNSYSVQALAGAGLSAGTVFSYAGVPLTWPDTPSGAPDNVVAQGQTIQLSGSGQRLAFAGASSPDSGGQGTIYYSDGTTSRFTVTLDNWFDPPGTGNAVIAEMPYLNDSNPATNGGAAGQRRHSVYVFAAAVDVAAGRTVQAVTLPAGGAVPASGRITGMHVFALGVGG